MSEKETEVKVPGPYKTFWIEWTKANNRDAREKVLDRANKKEFGEQVRFSLFGLGEFEPSYDLSPERIREIRKGMHFYASLER
jgi:hypothetical protein